MRDRRKGPPIFLVIPWNQPIPQIPPWKRNLLSAALFSVGAIMAFLMIALCATLIWWEGG